MVKISQSSLQPFLTDQPVWQTCMDWRRTEDSIQRAKHAVARWKPYYMMNMQVICFVYILLKRRC